MARIRHWLTSVLLLAFVAAASAQIGAPNVLAPVNNLLQTNVPALILLAGLACLAAYWP